METAHRTRRIAVVGSGVAGLTCAHELGNHHEVVLYEAEERLGGHANTVEVDDPDGTTVAVDTGFIVHNRRNYPNFTRLLDDLGVETQPSEMSFSVTDRRHALTYRATNPSTIFADRRNLLRPDMWRMLVDIARFWRAAGRLLREESTDVAHPASIGEFVDAGRYSDGFREWHLRPMIAAIWSADPTAVDESSAMNTLRFLDNHGLLGLGDRPQWRTITGGSRVYVDEIERRFDGKIRTGCPVVTVRRRPGGVEVVTAEGVEHFDDVILACHTDQALQLLEAPTAAEREILGAIGYRKNQAVLHTDTTVLSPNRRAWAAWNYDVDPATSGARVTYDLTTLQRLAGSRRYLVSLNLGDDIDPSRRVATFDYAHPVLDGTAIAAQRRLPEINGVEGVHFCGAWAGDGFHEDGVAAALSVCASFDAATSVRAFTPPSPGVSSAVARHERVTPQRHSFEHRLQMLWIDPDRPDDLCDRHPLWSARWPAPARFRRADYALPDDRRPLAEGVRQDLRPVLGRSPRGSVRMLTQPRMWGWLFNPITVYLAWHDDADDPVGLVAEVSNTPWKERHRYAVALHRDGPLRSVFDKQLHVSPFIERDVTYELEIDPGPPFELRIDVVPRDSDDVVLGTQLVVAESKLDRTSLTAALLHRPLPTHRVSARIHREALRLWRKGVPIVQHPRRHDTDRQPTEGRRS